MTSRKISLSVRCFMAVALCGVLATSAQCGVIVVADDFSTDGALAGQTPSPGPGTAWANHSGSGEFIQVAGGEAVLVHGGTSREDVNSAFAVQSTGIVNYSFDFSVDDLSVPFTAGDPEYFASFRGAGVTSLPGRLYLDAPTGSGDFSIGISARSGAPVPNTLWATDFSYGDVISVSVDYDIDGDQAFLSVDGGAAIASLAFPGGDPTTIDQFAFRQSNSSSDETIRIDNLIVTVVPEPTSIVLMFAGLIGFATRRRS